MDSLAEALPREIERVRERILPQYEAMLGMPNVIVGPAIAMMRHSISEAIKAAASGDVVAMLECYNDLKEYGD